MRVKEGETRLKPLKEVVTRESEEKSRQKKGLIERIWRLFDHAGEDEVSEVV